MVSRRPRQQRRERRRRRTRPKGSKRGTIWSPDGTREPELEGIPSPGWASCALRSVPETWLWGSDLSALTSWLVSADKSVGGTGRAHFSST